MEGFPGLLKHTPDVYWIKQNRLLAGATPLRVSGGSLNDRLAELSSLGVSTILCLQQEKELVESGASRALYESEFARIRTSLDAHILHLPIADFSVPGHDVAKRILDTLDEELSQGRTVYLHCAGGRGRTGTIAGCWLARHMTRDGQCALELLAALRINAGCAGGKSPETEEQSSFVRAWLG